MGRKTRTLARRLIDQSDVEAERLISIIRMTLAAMLFFGVTFVLSHSKSVGLETRQFELFSLLVGAACYFLLGMLNYYCATEERLKPWMRWVFNLGEIMLVSIQLYIDVADSDTPSLLIFASPVLLVAALVICVQVLRFQIRLHIYSTLILIGLCSLILFHDPQIGEPLSSQATHELQLLYSVPPNLMRLIMLSMMAALVGIAVYRSKRLIETVAREAEIAENRNRFLPSELTNSVTDEHLDMLRLGEERELAVIFADIRGFTQRSESMGPRETAKFLNHYRTLVTDAAMSNNGIIDKFIGDGVLIVFGLHSDINQACIDAFNTAQSLILAVEAWNENPSAQDHENIKIVASSHAGPAIIGAIGDDRRLEFTAVGKTINLASRIEEFAKQQNWTLAVSETTAVTAGLDTLEFVSAGPTLLRGSSEAIVVLGKP